MFTGFVAVIAFLAASFVIDLTVETSHSPVIEQADSGLIEKAKHS
jgi:methyl-accepting chemotaxis protein